jgi:hypothetical protein
LSSIRVSVNLHCQIKQLMILYYLKSQCDGQGPPFRGTRIGLEVVETMGEDSYKNNYSLARLVVVDVECEKYRIKYDNGKESVECVSRKPTDKQFEMWEDTTGLEGFD